MVEHHVQKQIITRLVESQHARYADLKPTNMDGNVFGYHLQNLIKQKLIRKNDQGTYELTDTGKLYGINNSLVKADALTQAHAIILLSIRDEAGRWLLRKRLVQPLYGKIGFIHGEPKANVPITESAANELTRRTGLIAKTFTVRGFGFTTMRQHESLVAYSSFTLIEASDLSGEFITHDTHGENAWYTEPDFTSDTMVPSMPNLVKKLSEPGTFFADLQYDLED